MSEGAVRSLLESISLSLSSPSPLSLLLLPLLPASAFPLLLTYLLRLLLLAAPCEAGLLMMTVLASWRSWRKWSDWVRWLTGKLEPTWTHVPCCLGVLEPHPGFPKNSCLVGNCSPHDYNLGTYLISLYFLLPPPAIPQIDPQLLTARNCCAEVKLGRFDSSKHSPWHLITSNWELRAASGWFFSKIWIVFPHVSFGFRNHQLWVSLFFLPSFLLSW